MAYQLTKSQEQYLADTDRMLNAPSGFSKAQIFAESGFNPKAQSKDKKGNVVGQGLGQIIESTEKAYEKKLGKSLDPMNPDDSLVLHRAIMMDNYSKFKNPYDAAKAYNAGWNKNNWNNEETVKYVSNINKLQKALGKNVNIQPPVAPTTDEQFAIDMNAMRKDGDLPYQDYGYTQNPDGSYGDIIDFDALMKEGGSVKEYTNPIDIEGTFPSKKDGQVNQETKSTMSGTIKNAIANMERKPSNTDYIGRDRTGIGMQLDLMADISGYKTPRLMNNKAFTGMTPDERIEQMDSREVGQANLFGKAAAGRLGQAGDIINDQYRDQVLSRGLTGDNITGMQNLARLLTPTNKGDNTVELLRTMSQSKYPSENQAEIVQKLQEAILKSKGY